MYQHPVRTRQPSLTQRLVTRKQISLDMFSIQETDFFLEGHEEDVEDLLVLPPGEECEEEEDVVIVKDEEKEKLKKLFLPLRFPPLHLKKTQHQHGTSDHGHGKGDNLTNIKEEEDLIGQDDHTEQGKEEGAGGVSSPHHHDGIIKVTRTDKIKTLILFCIMSTFLGVCVGWKTHQDESHMIFGTVGLACVTPCYGDVNYRNFFIGHHDKFHHGDVSRSLCQTLIYVLNSLSFTR